MAIKAHLEHPSNPSENRQHPRRSMYLETSGRIPGGAEANVTIHNLSVAGLLLETDADLDEGEVIDIDLPQIGGVSAAIVWHSGDLYGCAFDRVLSEAALAAAALRGTVIGSLDPVFPLGSSPASPSAHPPASSPASPLDHQTGAAKPAAHRGEPFGIRLNRLRRERSMTLADVAEALGVSKPTVWAWEKGKAKPIPERLDAIAQVLGVSADELRVSGGAGDSAALIEECRLRIATAYGTDPHNIRIMVEV